MEQIKRLIVTVVDDEFNHFVLGSNGVKYIEENCNSEKTVFNYLIIFDDSSMTRVFKPTSVEYKTTTYEKQP